MARFNQTVENALIAFVKSATGLTNVIWNMPDKQRPGLPYVALNIISGPTADSPPASRRKSLDIYTFTWHKLVTVNFQSFAQTNHLKILSDIKNGFYNPLFTDLRTSGVGVREQTEITDISFLLNSSHEMRASFDANIGYVEEKDLTTMEIQTINSSGVLQPGDIII